MVDTISEERRESFRIDITAMASTSSDIENKISAAECFPHLNAMSVLSKSDYLNTELALINERIKDLAARKAVDLLHQQVKLLTKLMDVKSLQESELETITVNISDGGCSFLSETNGEPETRLALALVLMPSYFALFTFARLIEVTPENEKYRWHLRFENLGETDRQNLLKHMFQAQTTSHNRQ